MIEHSFCFITDCHFTTSSRVRNGDILDDAVKKLQYVVDYCNQNNCILLCGGDFFDKPTVPDLVKTQVIKVLSRLSTKMYNIPGNHCTLYNNADFMYKTSYDLMTAAGLWEDLDSVPFVDCGDCIITSKIPITPKGKPQIVVYHGFLNIDDGNYTFRFTDLQTTDPVYVCLGHDHVVYEPIKFGENVKIFRPGSFIRGIRSDTNMRTPQMLHIKVSNGKLLSKLVPIRCRDFNEIFKAKTLKVSKSAQHDSYESIIAQMSNASSKQMTLKEAIKQVATDDVVEFAFQLMEKHKSDNIIKKN